MSNLVGILSLYSDQSTEKLVTAFQSMIIYVWLLSSLRKDISRHFEILNRLGFPSFDQCMDGGAASLLTYCLFQRLQALYVLMTAIYALLLLIGGPVMDLSEPLSSLEDGFCKDFPDFSTPQPSIPCLLPNYNETCPMLAVQLLCGG